MGNLGKQNFKEKKQNPNKLLKIFLRKVQMNNKINAPLGNTNLAVLNLEQVVSSLNTDKRNTNAINKDFLNKDIELSLISLFFEFEKMNSFNSNENNINNKVKEFKKKKLYTSYSKKNEIKYISIGLASPEKIKKWAQKTLPNGKLIGQVLNANTLHHKTFKPPKGGLFCERIFGPLKNFSCACVKKPSIQISKRIFNKDWHNYTSVLSPSIPQKFCRNCNIEYTWAIQRRYQLGYIELAVPVTHVWYLKGIPNNNMSVLLGLKRRSLQHIAYCSEKITLENALTKIPAELTPEQLFSLWQKSLTPLTKGPSWFRNDKKKTESNSKKPSLFKKIFQTSLKYKKNQVGIEKAIHFSIQLKASKITVELITKKGTIFEGLLPTLKKFSKDKKESVFLKKLENILVGYIDQCPLGAYNFSEAKFRLNNQKSSSKFSEAKFVSRSAGFNFLKRKKLNSIKMQEYLINLKKNPTKKLNLQNNLKTPISKIELSSKSSVLSSKTKLMLGKLSLNYWNGLSNSSYRSRELEILSHQEGFFLVNKFFNFFYKNHFIIHDQKVSQSYWSNSIGSHYFFETFHFLRLCFSNHAVPKYYKTFWLLPTSILKRRMFLNSLKNLKLQINPFFKNSPKFFKNLFFLLEKNWFPGSLQLSKNLFKISTSIKFNEIYWKRKNYDFSRLILIWFLSVKGFTGFLDDKKLNSSLKKDSTIFSFLSKFSEAKFVSSSAALNVQKNLTTKSLTKLKKDSLILLQLKRSLFFPKLKNSLMMIYSKSLKSFIKFEKNSLSFVRLVQSSPNNFKKKQDPSKFSIAKFVCPQGTLKKTLLFQFKNKHLNRLIGSFLTFLKPMKSNVILNSREESYKYTKNLMSFFFNLRISQKNIQKIKNNNYCFSYRERWFEFDTNDDYDKEWRVFSLYFTPKNNLLRMPIPIYKNRFDLDFMNNDQIITKSSLKNEKIEIRRIKNCGIKLHQRIVEHKGDIKNFKIFNSVKRIKNLMESIKLETPVGTNFKKTFKISKAKFVCCEAALIYPFKSVIHLKNETLISTLPFFKEYKLKAISKKSHIETKYFINFSTEKEEVPSKIELQNSVGPALLRHLLSEFNPIEFERVLIQNKENMKQLYLAAPDPVELYMPIKKYWKKFRRLKNKYDYTRKFYSNKIYLLKRNKRMRSWPISEKKAWLAGLLLDFDRQKGFVKRHVSRLRKKLNVLIRSQKLLKKLINKTSDPKLMTLIVLPVLPPDLRPIVKMDGQIASADLNRLYQRIIYRNDRLKKLLNNSILRKSYLLQLNIRLLQESVDNLISNGKSGVTPEKDSRDRLLKSLSDILKGKEGRFRQYLLGKRVDYSGRSVIIVGPNLKLHECGIPKEMAFELFLPFLLKHILTKGFAQTVIGAKKIIQKKPEFIWELLQEIMETSPVLLNRAPTLHRLGIQAFQPKLIEGKAILLHPLVCSAFNADFDGDQMAVHIPLTVEARAEAWKLMLSINNLLSPATGEPLAIPSQDMVLGCYYLTTTCNEKYIKHQKGSGLYFTSFSDVFKNYENKKIDLHSTIWLKWNGYFEHGNDQTEPLEIRINSYGNYLEVYPNLQKYYSRENILITQYIATTPGKVLFNFKIKETLTNFI